jgi:putative acetyltransferase
MADAREPVPVIERAQPDDGELLALIAALDEDLHHRYPPESVHPLLEGEAAEADFLIARIEGEAVGCGAITELAPGIGEIKRMYVRPERRGHRIGRHLLNALEGIARQRGYPIVRLEAGTRQPEATALYEAMGYRRIPCFGRYADDPFSICYEKRLGIG